MRFFLLVIVYYHCIIFISRLQPTPAFQPYLTPLKQRRLGYYKKCQFLWIRNENIPTKPLLVVRSFSKLSGDSVQWNQDDVMEKIKEIARELWDGEEIPMLEDSDHGFCEGEANADGIRFKERADYFQSQALMGCPKAQHSYGLLRWSGFGGVERDAKASAKFHAAAASQRHLDGMAVLGGCSRTGTGMPRKNKSLGLQLIDICASLDNPTGVNKKAALLEDEEDAFHLYETCWNNDRYNALLLFNLGWCYVHGEGVQKDREKGISFWKMAANKAPDEGSEEASWFLYEEYNRDDPKEANRWYDLAMSLGFEE